MEVKWLLSRSVTLSQAGRFHIKWTGWNLPAGPQCPAMKPEPTLALLDIGWSAEQCEHGRVASTFSLVAENQRHWGPGFS